MDLDAINFSNCCVRARRIMVDFEDRGWVDLLDMDRVMCGEEVISIRNCGDCPNHAIEHEEEVSDEVLQSWLTDPNWRFNSEDSNGSQNGLADSEKRKVVMSELFK